MKTSANVSAASALHTAICRRSGRKSVPVVGTEEGFKRGAGEGGRGLAAAVAPGKLPVRVKRRSRR